MSRSRLVVGLLFLLFGGVFATTAALAIDYCIEPGEPSCINSRYAFENELSSVRCKREVESYLDQISDYIGCLEHLKELHMQKSSAMLSKLNCRMRGTLTC